MEHIRGESREQITLFPEAIEDYIGEDNPVRFLDAFVDKLDMQSLGFKHATTSVTGAPPYNPKDLLKLYIYGYLNRIRTSRMLEREAGRNVEVMWLVRRLSPDHKTISDFRKDNAEALEGVFKEFVRLCKELELFGAQLVAVDSSKFKASNSRSRVKDKKGIEQSVKRIEESIIEYLKELDENDQVEEGTDEKPSKEELRKKIESLKHRKLELDKAKEALDKSGDKYISLTDPECRLIKDGHGIDPSYKMQTSVDAKYMLISDYEVTQDASDHNHLSIMASAARRTLEVEELAVCADTGYYDIADIKACDDGVVITYVPSPELRIPNRTGVPTVEYYPDKFTYDEESDSHRCPEGRALLYECTYKRKRDGRVMRMYRGIDCSECSVRGSCTTSPKGRQLSRWEHQDVIDRLKERLQTKPDIIRRRKAIIEHVYGTIKDTWGYRQLLLRGVKKVTGEIALMNLAYNIKRALAVLGINDLITYLQTG